MNRERRSATVIVVLTSADVVVALHLAANPRPQRSFAAFAHEVHMSKGGVFQALTRLRAVGLVDGEGAAPSKKIIPFVLHGVRYLFPVTFGRRVRGVAAGPSTPDLASMFAPDPVRDFVWADPAGNHRGTAILPIDPRIPKIAVDWPRSHRLFGAIDLLRIGSARDAEIASSFIVALLTEPA